MIIYKTINHVNGKIYVGKYCGLSKSYLGSGKYLTFAVNKYGKENFTKEIIDTADNHKQLCEKERFWINFYDARNSKIGYNRANGGGSGGVKHSELTRLKQSIANMGHIVLPETRIKISISEKGRRLSENTKQKISEYQKKKFKNKANHPMYGKHLSEEHKANLSMSISGENHPMYGKKHSEESKQKMRISQIKSEEIKQKISDALKGRPCSETVKMALRQIVRSDEVKQKMSEGMKKSWMERKLAAQL